MPLIRVLVSHDGSQTTRALLIISPSLGLRLAHHVRSDRRVEGPRLSNRPQHSALPSVRNRRRRDSARGDRDGRVLSEVGTKWWAMARPGDDLAALLFGGDVQASHTRATERFHATGGRTGELRQDRQSAFVVTHIGRAGLIVQGTH